MKRALTSATALSLVCATTVAFGFEFSGQLLPAAIEELEARGLSILYSSDLIKPGMYVREAPSEREPRALLEEITRPHGIRVAEGPGGVLLLTRLQRAASAPTPPAAAEPPDAEIIVTASRYEWVRIPQPSLTRLSEAELRVAPNVGDDPLRTFARLPGMAASDVSAKLNIRGGAADEVLVRFDGLRLLNPFHLKDFQSIFSAIDTALIGAVDVYTGGFPVNFGDRMSGVVDIHPVRADAATRREIALSLYNASALATGRYNRGRGDWTVAARRGNLDRVLDWSGMNLGEPTYSDVHAHLAHALGDSMVISANMLRFDDDIELADSDLEEQARARYRDRYAWLRLDAHPHESLTGSTIVAHTEIESVRSGNAEQPGISRGSLEDRRGFTVRSLQTDWSWHTTAGVVQFGGEWRHSEGRYQYRDQAEFDLVLDTGTEPVEHNRTRQIDLRPDGDQFGAYLSLRSEIAPRVVLEGGLRGDLSTLSDDDATWSPRVSVLYRLRDSAAVRASWGRFFQSEAVDELPVSDGLFAFSPAQRADHWLLSFEQRLGERVDLRVEGYRKRYSQLRPRFENLLNEMVLLPELKPDRVRLAAARARATGVELSLRSVRSQPLFWWASYTWSRAEDLFADRELRRQWDQEHSFKAGLGWESEAWELSLAGAWRSGWPRTALELSTSDDEAVVIATAVNSRRHESYIDIDVRVARQFAFQDDTSLTVFFEVSNALNRRNVCCTEFEIDDESDSPTLVLESIRSLPLLPSLGIVWRF